MKKILKLLCYFFFHVVFTLCYKIDYLNLPNKNFLYVHSSKSFNKNIRTKQRNGFVYFQKVKKEEQVCEKEYETNKERSDNEYFKDPKEKIFQNSLSPTSHTQRNNEREQTVKESIFLNTRGNYQKIPNEKKKGKLSYNCEHEERQLREQIEKERKKREEIFQKNQDFVKKNFKYTSDFLPINVEKRYTYQNFKYSEEIVLYIFFIINLFKHEQFQNKMYKDNLEKGAIDKGIEREEVKEDEDENENENENEDDDFSGNNNDKKKIEERNGKIVNNIIKRFGEKFQFFNSSERIQREDWANIFKLEKEDKMNFLKNIKIKNEKKKEHFLLIYYCNWQYACMALYNALHNIFHNTYNTLQFYELIGKENEEQMETKKKDSIKDKLKKSYIEQIREMYIRDMQNNEPMDIESLILKDQQFFSTSEISDSEKKNEKEKKEKGEKEKVNEQRKGERETYDKLLNEKGNTFQGVNQIKAEKIKIIEKESEKGEKLKEEKKTWQEMMEEEKKKLDEEYFLYGYSQYENDEEIKKEEEEIKKTKHIIEEEKKYKTTLNRERDFHNIYKDFYLKLNNYKMFYNFMELETAKTNQQTETSNVIEYIRKIKNKKYKHINSKTENEEYTEEKKKEVNVNVIFVRISNSIVIGKTKNLKEKIKKKWIYCHEKEIKFYELILSTMLNENIYYKDIPHVELFTLNYDKQKMYDFYNSVNTNLKHSFIHKGKVHDVFNNIVNGQMDVYNFDIFDRSRHQKKDLIDEPETKNKKECIENNESQINEDIVIEEMDAVEEGDEEKEYMLALEQYPDMEREILIKKDEMEKEQKHEHETKQDWEQEKDQLYKKELNKQKEITKKKKEECPSTQYILNKKKHNKKERSKYEALFRQKYNNIFLNKLKDNLRIEKISSISNFDSYANFIGDTFKDLSLVDFLKRNNLSTNTKNSDFEVDKNYVYCKQKKIPKEVFPFFLQLSMAFKYEHTTLLINAPKKVQFIFRNV